MEYTQNIYKFLTVCAECILYIQSYFLCWVFVAVIISIEDIAVSMWIWLMESFCIFTLNINVTICPVDEIFMYCSKPSDENVKKKKN